MNDKFKFRIVLHQDKYEEYSLEPFINQKIFDVQTINIGDEDSTIEIIAEYPNGDWAVREIDEKDVDLIQCTGLKDKNGTLIYEGDIVTYKKEKFIISFLKPYASFVLDNLKHTWIDIYPSIELEMEVIGNIYENPELIKE